MEGIDWDQIWSGLRFLAVAFIFLSIISLIYVLGRLLKVRIDGPYADPPPSGEEVDNDK